MNFGSNLVKYRKKIGLSQEDVANKINVTRQTISNWELEITYPDVKQIIDLANALYTHYTNLISNFFVSDEEINNIQKKIIKEIKEKYNQFQYSMDSLRLYSVEDKVLHIGCCETQKSIIKMYLENFIIEIYNKYSNKKISSIYYHIDDRLN